jgi:murein DD-endopeptidase MepM/ murein hydrolase activator NlpD
MQQSLGTAMILSSELLNRYILLSDGTSSIVKISAYGPDSTYSGGNGPALKCLGDIHQISTNPHVCLIRNDAYFDPNKSLGVQNLDVKSVISYMNAIDFNFTYLDQTTEFGTIGNIFVNLDYLYGLSINDTLASQDKKEKNDIVLFDYIKSVMAGINSAIGNVANFDIFVDPEDSVARIIDVNYVDDTSRDQAYENAFPIEVHNLNSVVRSYKFESQIFPEQSTTIAIGAQVEGGALGTNTDTLVDFNKGLVDRIIPRKVSPTTPPNTTLSERLKGLQSNWVILADLFIQLNPSWWESKGDYDVEESSKYSNSLKDIINFFTSFTNKNTKNRGIIPTKLSLEMDGIGGMVIGNMFRISDDIIPKGYKGSPPGSSSPNAGAKIGYLVTGLGHSVQNNDWVTRIDAQFIVLDEPMGSISNKDIAENYKVQAINRIATSTSSPENSSAFGTAVAPDNVSSLGFGLPLQAPYTLNSLPTRANQKQYKIPIIVGTDTNHQGIDITGPGGFSKNTNLSAVFGGKGTNGDAIFAVQDGTVKFAGAAEGFGYWIYINHTVNNELYTSIYGHMPLDSIRVKPGETVTKGQPIALLGNEGASGGYHLHFELWKGDRKTVLDPLDYLPFFESNGGDIPDNTIVRKGGKYG